LIFLYKQIIPLLQSGNWYTSKFLYFKDWSILAKLQYYEYQNLPQSKDLIQLIKSRMYNYRLSTHPKCNGHLIISQNKLKSVFSLPAPYLDYGILRGKKGIYIAGSLELVQQSTFNLIVTDPRSFGLAINLNTTKSYTNLDSCTIKLKIIRKQIVNCLIYKSSYKWYNFVIENKGHI